MKMQNEVGLYLCELCPEGPKQRVAKLPNYEIGYGTQSYAGYICPEHPLSDVIGAMDKRHEAIKNKYLAICKAEVEAEEKEKLELEMEEHKSKAMAEDEAKAKDQYEEERYEADRNADGY